MSTADFVTVGGTAAVGVTNASSCRKRTRLMRSSARKSTGKITVRSDTGAACWDCAKYGHTCKPVPVGTAGAVRVFWELNRQLRRANADPDDAWRTAAQRAAQQLRACGSGAALPATPGPAPASASFGEIAEKSPEERKIMALETIAEAARLWILNKSDEEEEEQEDEEEEEGN
ncbi:hypothetical protein EDB81DRAFT_848920 [Dactylonectria macrodidyma]|uniref:Uncharacterized protein n=1 Tax=Dactylonectria macrodidyma TaxID=307937 RepID=A0A9P9D3Y0_9HYPO|nr:hypothetical protein EDB81DRAFT_848920 [Dactylonectria macrodidyma]